MNRPPPPASVHSDSPREQQKVAFINSGVVSGPQPVSRSAASMPAFSSLPAPLPGLSAPHSNPLLAVGTSSWTPSATPSIASGATARRGRVRSGAAATTSSADASSRSPAAVEASTAAARAAVVGRRAANMSRRALLSGTATVAASVAASAVMAEAPEVPSKPKRVAWGYLGDKGPEYWANLDPAWSACGNVGSQSPIAFSYRTSTPIPPDQPRPTLNLTPARFKARRGPALPGQENQIVLFDVYSPPDAASPPANPAILTTSDGYQFQLKGFHFHAPESEHVWETYGAAEVHFVFQRRKADAAPLPPAQPAPVFPQPEPEARRAPPVAAPPAPPPPAPAPAPPAPAPAPAPPAPAPPVPPPPYGVPQPPYGAPPQPPYGAPPSYPPPPYGVPPVYPPPYGPAPPPFGAPYGPRPPTYGPPPPPYPPVYGPSPYAPRMSPYGPLPYGPQPSSFGDPPKVPNPPHGAPGHQHIPLDRPPHVHRNPLAAQAATMQPEPQFVSQSAGDGMEATPAAGDKPKPASGGFKFSKDPGNAVVGVIFQEDRKTDPWLKKILGIMLPTGKDFNEFPDEGKIVNLDLSEIIPNFETTDIYSYDGSLTTPPGSEGIRWFVCGQRATISRTDVERMENAQGGTNVRPIQAVGNRRVARFVRRLDEED